MARIRTIKPDFFRHEDLYELEEKTSLPIRLAFAGLFTVADREGRFKWKPSQIKLDVLPYDCVSMSDVLNALWLEGFIEFYVASDGKEYGFIPSFKTHQIINNRESVSTLPEPTFETIVSRVNHASTTRHDLAQGEGKGKEGKGIGIGKELLVEKSTDTEIENKDSAISFSDCTPNSISTASDVDFDDSLTSVEAEGFEKEKKIVAPENFPFEEFWNLYDKKRGKAESIRQWARLKEEDKAAVMAYIPAYKLAQPDESFRKDPERFLKKRAWLDELPKQQIFTINNNGKANQGSNSNRGTNPRGTSFFDNKAAS